MPITKQDIKILASERLTDDPDGGGLMTGREIVSGVQNAVWPDLSDVDRARGTVMMRKLYAAVLNSSQDPLSDAHVIIDQPPGDPAACVLLAPAAGVAETRAGLISRLDSGAAAQEFHGVAPLAVPAGLGTRVVQLAAMRAQLIPPAVLGGSAGGRVWAAEDNARRCMPYVVTGYSTAYGAAFDGRDSVFFAQPQLGSLRAAGASVTGLQVIEVDGYLRLGYQAAGSVLMSGAGYYPVGETGITLQYRPAFEVRVPRQSQAFAYSGSTGTMTLMLDHPSAEGSERIEWTGSDGQPYALANEGPPAFVTSPAGSAAVNRAYGFISLTMTVPPAPGGAVTVTYARKDHAAEVGMPGVAAADGGRPLTLEPGMALVEAQFSVGSERLRVTDQDWVVRVMEVDTSQSLPRVVAGATRGTFDPESSKLYLTGTGAIEGWTAVQAVTAAGTLTGARVTAQIEASLLPETLVITGETAGGAAVTVAADAAGVFSGAATGSYSADTGRLSLVFGSAVKLGTLRWTATRAVAALAGQDVAGVNPEAFDISGRVPMFGVGRLVVVHNTQDRAPLTVANGQTVSLPRNRLADVRVLGADGQEIFSGWSADLAAGTVNFTAVAGYAQPVTIRHRVEDLAVVQSMTEESCTLSLTRELTHDYPAATSYCSSALMLGDLQARALAGYGLSSWGGNFDQTVASLPLLADFNEAAWPIEVTDDGAITERWAVVFINTAAFRIVGEQVGEVVSSGSTAVDCAPVNPATGKPYFRIRAAGWGTGWSIGNVYRFDTAGACAPWWELLSVAPSEPVDDAIVVSAAVRGSINT